MTEPTFADLGLSEATLEAIEAAGFETPSPIQVGGVPAIQTGADVILQAQTGTGKTAAFVLPLVDRLEPNPGVVDVLVLVPTRELAKQVAGEFEKFGGGRGIHATAVYGGASFEKQYEALERCQVVVATPGRLLDLNRRKKIVLDTVRVFGLDESDEMLSMGFERDVFDIVALLPEERQSFLCSATYNEDIKRVARGFITEPTVVDVSSDRVGAESVDHVYYRVPAVSKIDALLRLLDSEAGEGAIIFANTRAATFRVHHALQAEDVSVGVLNGELSQAEREKALAQMRNDEFRFLVATDVAARGIDISGLPAVINYDMPESPDVYIHRTGRTGRAGQAGVAYSLVTPADISVFHALHKFYKLPMGEAQLPSRGDVRQLKADRVLDSVLEPLDSAGTLSYARHLPLARRLAERSDGPRTIAKLIAHFDATREADHDARGVTIADMRAVARPSTVSIAAAAVSDAAQEAATKAASDADDEATAPTALEQAPAAPETAPHAEVDRQPDAKHAVDAPENDGFFAWLVEQPSRRSRGRWRSINAIATALDADPDEVKTWIESDERVEESRNRPGQWRVRRDFLPPREEGDDERPKRDERDERPKRDERRARDERDERDERPKRDEREPRRDRGTRDDAAPARQENAAATPKAAPKPKSPFAKHGPFTDVTLNLSAEQVSDELALATALVEIAGFDLEDIGGIKVGDEKTKMPVLQEFAQAFVDALDGAKWENVVLNARLPRSRSRSRSRR